MLSAPVSLPVSNRRSAGPALLALAFTLCSAACSKTAPETAAQPAAGTSAPEGEQPAGCPAHAKAAARVAGTTEEQETLAYWLGRYSAEQLDAPLLTTDQIAAYNAALGRRPGDNMASQRDLLEPVSRALVVSDMHDRQAYVRERIEAGRYVDEAGAPIAAEKLAAFDAELPQPLAPSL